MRARKMLPSALCLVAYIALVSWVVNAASSAAKQIQRGFSTTHDPSYSEFQPLLADPIGFFSLGFLRLNSTQLDLAILHLPSSLPVWRANHARSALWTGSISFFLSFLSFFFSFPFSSSSPASSSSRLFFTAAVARSVVEGRLNPTRRRPSAGGCRCLGLGPGEPAGTPPGPNQHAGAGLAPVLGEGLRWPSPLPPPPRHPYTLPPFSPINDQWRGIDAGGGGASAGPSSLFPSLPFSLSLSYQW